MKATTQLPAAATNLPLALTPLVGRARELESIGEILGRNRLATLTGPGGVGKTRLALELARRQIGRRGDGVWPVDLTAAARPENLPHDTAPALPLPPAPRAPPPRPVGVEPAAAGMTMMAPTELLTKVGPPLGPIAGGGSRLSPPRHRTVRATVEC